MEEICRSVYQSVDVHSYRVVDRSKRNDRFELLPLKQTQSLFYKGLVSSPRMGDVLLYMLNKKLLTYSAFFYKGSFDMLMDDLKEEHFEEISTTILQYAVVQNGKIPYTYFVKLLQHRYATSILQSSIKDLWSRMIPDDVSTELRRSSGRSTLQLIFARSGIFQTRTSSSWLKIVMDVYQMLPEDVPENVLLMFSLPELARILPVQKVLDLYRSFTEDENEDNYMGTWDDYQFLVTHFETEDQFPSRPGEDRPFKSFVCFEDLPKIVKDWVGKGFTIEEYAATYTLATGNLYQHDKEIDKSLEVEVVQILEKLAEKTWIVAHRLWNDEATKDDGFMLALMFAYGDSWKDFNSDDVIFMMEYFMKGGCPEHIRELCVKKLFKL